jgi:hypothetical protein
MITVLVHPRITTETISYVQDDRTLWDKLFGGERAKREKVRILTTHGRQGLTDLILRSDPPLELGVKFDYLDETVYYQGILPIEQRANSIYRCLVDKITHREKSYLTRGSTSGINI